ncbi:Imm5 family immunity protein [Pseudomonas sp. GNP013]
MNEKSLALIKALLSEVTAAASGELLLPLRKLLWETITEDQSEEERRLTLTKLDVICVEYGSSFWVKKFGDVEELSSILSMALALANGVIPEEKAMSVRDEFYVAVVEDQSYSFNEYPAMFVGHAAANTVITAASEYDFDPADRRSDRDLDPAAFEPSYLVASAFAGGLAENGDPESRRKFWQWYLTDAVRQVL